MSLQRLEVGGLRNLRKTQLEGCGRINILSGSNGSGKTSLLEAIYLVGMGRSFRGGRAPPLISHDLDACAIFGELAVGHPDGCQSIGLTRFRQGKQALHINHSLVANATELARALPVQIINSDSFALLGGGPKTRRQFMDWGVFHVKPSFLEHWRRAQRSLEQRNSLLRRQGGNGRDRMGAHAFLAEIEVWSRELAQCADSIDRLRSKYIEDMLPLFGQVLQRLVDLPGLTLEYHRGWKSDEALLEALEEGLERDLRFRTTTIGPHRANLDIRLKGAPVAEVLSRGQQKLVVSSLQLAQGWYLSRETGRKCVYLIDDLPAELDRRHRVALCELLDEMKCQVFMTSVDADVIGDRWEDEGAVRRFHVEQGKVFCN